MNFKFFLSRIKNIILNPVKAWEAIVSEAGSVKSDRNSYLFPLIILVSVSAFSGSLIFTHSELSPIYSIFVGIKCFVLFFLVIYATTYIFSEITYPLDLGKDFTKSFRIILYSSTPLFLCQILSRLFESLLFVNVLSLYGLYIFWVGTEKLLTAPQYKKMPMLVATTITLVGIFIITNLFFTLLIDRLYFSFFA